MEGVDFRVTPGGSRCQRFLLSFSVVCLCPPPVPPPPPPRPHGACSLPRSVLCCGGNIRSTDLCYQALVAWARGSGHSASVLMQEMINIYSWSSWSQHHGSGSKLWRTGVVTKPPPSCSPTSLSPSSLRGSSWTLSSSWDFVSAASFAGLRVLVLRGER